MEVDPSNGAESTTQVVGLAENGGLHVGLTQFQQVVHRGLQAELGGHVGLGQLEPGGIVGNLIAQGLGPPRTPNIENGWSEYRLQAGANKEESRATRAAKPFASSPRQSVDAQALDVSVQLADRLAGIQEYERTVLVGNFDNVADRIDQTRVVGDLDYRDETDAVIHHLGQSVEVDSAVRGAGHNLDPGAGQTGPVQQVDGIVCVLGSGHQDPVSGLERNSAEEGGPGSGGTVGQGDAPGFAAEEPAQRHFEILPFR